MSLNFNIFLLVYISLQLRTACIMNKYFLLCFAVKNMYLSFDFADVLMRQLSTGNLRHSTELGHRPKVKTNGHFTTFMQTRSDAPDSLSHYQVPQRTGL